MWTVSPAPPLPLTLKKNEGMGEGWKQDFPISVQEVPT
jgi:hypothetical protein